MITKIGQPASEPGRFRTLSFCLGFLSGDRKKMKKNPLLVEEGGLGTLLKEWFSFLQDTEEVLVERGL